MMSKRSSKKDPKKNEQLEAVVFNFKNFNKTLNNFFEKKGQKFQLEKRARHYFKKKKKRGKTS